MDLILRCGAAGDLESGLDLITDRFLYEAEDLTALRSMWSHVQTSRAGLFGVVADARRPSTMLSFCSIVFVTNERAEQYQHCTCPGVGYRIAEEWSAHRRPFLTDEEVAIENAGAGLNVLITHHGNRDLGDEGYAVMSYGLFEVCRRYYRGLNIRSWTHEIFDPYGGTIGGQAGFRVNRYTDDQLRERGIPMDMAPVIIMATREDAIAHPESQFLGMLFLSFATPRFRLTLREQDVLRLAIDGHTDDSIAQSLAESSSNVKKHFRSIYDKVERSGVADALPRTETLPAGHRGTEMRRYVLNYLREHPEELHPYNPKHVSACAPVAVK